MSRLEDQRPHLDLSPNLDTPRKVINRLDRVQPKALFSALPGLLREAADAIETNGTTSLEVAQWLIVMQTLGHRGLETLGVTDVDKPLDVHDMTMNLLVSAGTKLEQGVSLRRLMMPLAATFMAISGWWLKPIHLTDLVDHVHWLHG